MGFKTAMKVLEKGRIHIAAICVGVAERMLEDALAYAMERKQFGQPIAEFQLVQAMLADSKMEVYAARCMVIDCRAPARRRPQRVHRGLVQQDVRLRDVRPRGRPRGADLRRLRLRVDHGIERFYRDVRLFRLYEGTTQIQQIVIARNMVREATR
jgi:acyl-CoA dehydrogenase